MGSWARTRYKPKYKQKLAMRDQATMRKIAQHLAPVLGAFSVTGGYGQFVTRPPATFWD
jgi:hypothetical protein